MVAKATKSTKDVKPKAEDVLDQSTDVLADALGTARDETADIAPEDELKAEKPEVKTVESNSEPLEEESVFEPNNPDPWAPPDLRYLLQCCRTVGNWREARKCTPCPPAWTARRRMLLT